MHNNVQDITEGAIGGLRVLCGFFYKSFSFFDILKINAFEEHRELGAGKCDTRFIGYGQREMQCSFFETFIPDGESIVVPIKDFDFVAAFVEENKKGRRERIGMKAALNDTEQTIE